MIGRAAGVLRHAAGFALAPAVAPVAVLAYEVFRMSMADARPGLVAPGFSRSALDLLVAFATRWVPAGYAVAIVVGLPIVLALRAARRLAFPWVIGVSAAVTGTAVVAAMLVADGGIALDDPEAAAALSGAAALLAAAVSGAYCAIAGVPLRPAAPPRGARAGAD
ncbi:MAG TPA: hypothetical protein VF841_19855 [Anaeromyxobacter sp.]